MSVFIPTGHTQHIAATFSFPNTSDLTCMCWGNLTGATTGTYRNFVSVEPWMHLQTGTDGLTFNAGTDGLDNLGSLLATNTWYHLAETFLASNSATSRLICGYINGIQNVRVTDTTSFAAGNYTGVTPGNYAGSFNGNTYNLPANGQIRDVRIWTRCLSATEIVQEMNSKIPINIERLLAWYLFDDNIVNDNTGRGNILTLTGTGIVLQNGGPLKPYVARATNYLR